MEENLGLELCSQELEDITISAGPESFQKGALFRKKVALNLWYVDTRQGFARTVPEHLKVCHNWLIKKKKNFSYLVLFSFFMHIIQLSLFSSEY